MPLHHNGKSDFGIRFDLYDLENVPAWGEPGERKLHWYGLTFGRYWIETAHGSPTEYTTAIQEHWSHGKYPDYYIATFLDDLLSILSASLEPVPLDIANRTANPGWIEKAERWRNADAEARWDLWYSGTQWWHQRELSMGYLQHSPHFWIWCVEDTMFVRWKADGEQNGIPVWVLPNGEFSMPVTTFQAAVVQFGQEFLAAMERRIRSIQEAGWRREDCTVDIEQLVQDQVNRRGFFEKVIDEKQVTDWRNFRSSLDILLGQMGEPMTSLI